MSKLGKILISKLSKEELGLFCDSFDDGSLDDILYNELFPADVKNYPDKYVKVDDRFKDDVKG